ncbi:MAG: caspase domain-containing protein [Gammaproteobacteria bacterium]
MIGALLASLWCSVAVAADSRLLGVTRTDPVASDRKVALVIGNAAYASGALKNPVNDARAMAGKLQSLGFDVIVRENVKAREYGAALRELRNRLQPGAVALFFYAGHGLQIKGRNYLPAVDADIRSEDDVPQQSLDLAQVFDTLEEAKARVNLVFLDACRNNPYARSFRSMTGGGLAGVGAAPSGTLISYATRPGSVADDGDGRHGLYTSELLRQMDVANVPVEMMLKRVGASVKQGSAGRQEPWTEGMLEGDFMFRVDAAAAPAATVAASPAPAPAPRADDGSSAAAVVPMSAEDALQEQLQDYDDTAFARDPAARKKLQKAAAKREALRHRQQLKEALRQ